MCFSCFLCIKAVMWYFTGGKRHTDQTERHLGGYLILRNMRREWLVFMAARAASSVEMRCRRVLGSVWRTLLLLLPPSQPRVRSRRIVSMGMTCWRIERLANWQKAVGVTGKEKQRDGIKIKSESKNLRVKNLNLKALVQTSGIRGYALKMLTDYFTQNMSSSCIMYHAENSIWTLNPNGLSIWNHSR